MFTTATAKKRAKLEEREAELMHLILELDGSGILTQEQHDEALEELAFIQMVLLGMKGEGRAA